MKKSELKSIIKEILQELDLDEISGSGGAGAYSTPGAFSSGASDIKRKKKIAAQSMPGGNVISNSSTLDETLSESRYHNFKKSADMKNHAKICYSLKEINRMLREVEFLSNINNKLKLEVEVPSTSYWKRTHQDVNQIMERIKRISTMVKGLSK